MPLILKKVVHLYIIYKLNTWSRDLNTDFTLHNCFFGAVKLTKNADLDKYGYSGYDIEFDGRSQFSWSNGICGKKLLFLVLV